MRIYSCEDRGIVPHPVHRHLPVGSSQGDGEESEDDDFEDVPLKEGYEATVPDYPHQPSSSGWRPGKGSGREGGREGGREEWNLSQMSTEEGDPTTGQPSVDVRGQTAGPRSVWVDYLLIVAIFSTAVA